MQVISGKSNESVTFKNGINNGLLYQWIRNYKICGYNDLIEQKKGRKPKDFPMNNININTPRKLKESEYEELIHLRAENEYIKAENEMYYGLL